jgi:hypothetical protein
MPVPSVELDDELVLRPVAVDLPDPKVDVPHRIGDLRVLGQEFVEGDFEPGGALRLGAVGRQRRFEPADPRTARVPLERGFHRVEVEDALAHRLGDQPVELSRMLARGELDQHPRDRADSESVANHDLLRTWRLLDPVHRQPRSPAAARGHHGQLDLPGVDFPQPPHGC